MVISKQGWQRRGSDLGGPGTFAAMQEPGHFHLQLKGVHVSVGTGDAQSSLRRELRGNEDQGGLRSHNRMATERVREMGVEGRDPKCPLRSYDRTKMGDECLQSMAGC